MRATRVAIVLLLICASTAEAQSKAKKKAPQGYRQGDDVVFRIRGDEARPIPNTEKAGIVGKGWIALPVEMEGDSQRTDDRNAEVYNAWIDAGRAGDSIATERLLRQRRIIKVESGTKMLVLNNRSPNGAPPNYRYGLIPAAPEGVCRVRIVDGDHKDRVISVPARNLAPAGKPE